MKQAGATLTTPDAIAALRAALGDAAVDVGDARRALVAQDVLTATAPVKAVVAPRTAEDVVAIVRVAAAHGLHVVPRGAGASYTAGYLSGDPAAAIVLDMTAMDRILSIAPQDMYALVEPGCTWAALREALAPHGLRAAFWGPLSGLRATVGGAISQNAIFWGSGVAGAAADTVLGLEVVTGNGEVVRTGSLGVADASPFFRQFGPDLTGLFTGDAGALGVKTKIALRLSRLAGATGARSFALPDHKALAALLSESARRGLAATQMGMDSGLKDARLARDGLWADIGHLLRLAGSAKSPLGGLADAWRTVRAGRGLLDGFAFSAHLFLEGRDERDIELQGRQLRAIALSHGGVEVEATVPRMMLARPFGPLTGMLGPKGERWTPVHGVLPHSAAVAGCEAVAKIFAACRERFEQHGVTTGLLFTTIGVNGFVIEPMLMWPDGLHALHREMIDAGRLARHPVRPDAPDARALVLEVRDRIVAALDALGAAHMQVGRYYPYRSRTDKGQLRVLAAVREDFDPRAIINPGALP